MHNIDDNMKMLLRGFISLESEEECCDFLGDLCTMTEMIEMSKRLYAARLLSENRTYNEVASETGLSTATISRVNRCLKYGEGGYRRVLDRLREGTK